MPDPLKVGAEKGNTCSKPLSHLSNPGYLLFYILLYYEIGSHCVALAGLKLEIQPVSA